MKRSAVFSADRRYRYELWRVWGDERNFVNFICLNPSTADEQTDDQTIRKCIKFAKSWGYEALCVTNLFAWRSTDRRVLRTEIDPIGRENDFVIERIAAEAAIVIAAWSQDGNLHDRSLWVRRLIKRPIHILKMGKKEPQHPLYLPDATQPVEWNELPEVKS